jgi:hypothetical protein
MKNEKILKSCWGRWSNDFVSEDLFIETLYNSLTNHPRSLRQLSLAAEVLRPPVSTKRKVLTKM